MAASIKLHRTHARQGVKLSKYLYLLHFDEPLHHAQHYLGITEDLDERLQRHFRGDGAKLTAEFARLGIGFTLARAWSNATQEIERSIKQNRNGRLYCPICYPHKARKSKSGIRVIPSSALRDSGLKTIYKHKG